MRPTIAVDLTVVLRVSQELFEVCFCSGKDDVESLAQRICLDHADDVWVVQFTDHLECHLLVCGLSDKKIALFDGNLFLCKLADVEVLREL